MREEAQPREAGVGSRALRGLALGLFVGTSFSALVLLLWLLNGRSLGYLDAQIGEAVLAYLTWGAVVGTLAGAFWPGTRSAVGAAIVGAVVIGSGLLTFQWLRGATRTEYIVGAVLGVVGGGVAGYRILRDRWHGGDS